MPNNNPNNGQLLYRILSVKKLFIIFIIYHLF